MCKLLLEIADELGLVFYIYTVDEGHVGNYTLTVTLYLDNIAEFADLDPNMDDYISNVNDPSTWAGTGNSGVLIYQATFDFDLEIAPPESDYEEPDNTPPYLLPPPENFFVYVGEYYEFFVGNIYDAESVNQTMSIEVDLQTASRYLQWDDVSLTLTHFEGVDDDLDIGFYEFRVTVWDNFDTVNIDGYVECADREFASEALKNAC